MKRFVDYVTDYSGCKIIEIYLEAYASVMIIKPKSSLVSQKI